MTAAVCRETERYKSHPRSAANIVLFGDLICGMESLAGVGHQRMVMLSQDAAEQQIGLDAHQTNL